MKWHLTHEEVPQGYRDVKVKRHSWSWYWYRAYRSEITGDWCFYTEPLLGKFFPYAWKYCNPFPDDAGIAEATPIGI